MGVTRTLEMGLSPRDFFRLFPLAAAGYSYRVRDDGVTLDQAGRRLVVRLSAQDPRRVGPLRLPVTRIELEFDGFTESEIQRFMERFERAFQRAGG